MKYYAISTYPCLVKTQDEAVELEKNDILEVENEDFLFVYPQEACQLPFYINLKTPKENSFFSIIKRNNEAFLIFEKSASFRTTTQKTLVFDNKDCFVKVENHVLSFEFEGQCCQFDCAHDCSSCKIFKSGSYAVAQFEKDVYLFCSLSHKLSHIFADDIAWEEDYLQIKKHFHDSENRAKTAKYQIGEGITLKEESFSYGNKKKHPLKALLPYKFLESIKANDFSFAYKMLCDSLQAQISEEDLKAFLSNITNFFALNEKEFIVFTQKDKLYLSFVTQADKIQDISIDNL